MYLFLFCWICPLALAYPLHQGYHAKSLLEMKKTPSTKVSHPNGLAINHVVPLLPYDRKTDINSCPAKYECKYYISTSRGDDGGKVGGVMTPLARTRCQFLKGGVCKEHGEGARKHWKPVMTTFTGPNGEERRKMTKKLYYVCDLDMSGRKKLRQTRLSFGQKQGGDIKGGDTDLKNLGIVLMSTEGQISGPAVEKKDNENQLDVYRLCL